MRASRPASTVAVMPGGKLYLRVTAVRHCPRVSGELSGSSAPVGLARGHLEGRSSLEGVACLRQAGQGPGLLVGGQGAVTGAGGFQASAGGVDTHTRWPGQMSCPRPGSQWEGSGTLFSKRRPWGGWGIGACRGLLVVFRLCVGRRALCFPLRYGGERWFCIPSTEPPRFTPIGQAWATCPP